MGLPKLLDESINNFNIAYRTGMQESDKILSRHIDRVETENERLKKELKLKNAQLARFGKIFDNNNKKGE